MNKDQVPISCPYSTYEHRPSTYKLSLLNLWTKTKYLYAVHTQPMNIDQVPITCPYSCCNVNMYYNSTNGYESTSVHIEPLHLQLKVYIQHSTSIVLLVLLALCSTELSLVIRASLVYWLWSNCLSGLILTSYSFIFSLFNQIMQFYNKWMWKWPSSIWRRDSNSLPYILNLLP